MSLASPQARVDGPLPVQTHRPDWQRLEFPVLLATLVLVIGAVLHFAWTGFIVSDDGYYVTSGLGWLNKFPYVAHHFGTVRAAVGIPIAAMIGLFGYSEFSVVLSSMLFYAATLALTFYVLSRIVGNRLAFAAAAGLATVPLLALKSTIPSADLPELCFVVASFWLFWTATERPSRAGALLLAAGVSIGLAFSAHEVTAALLFFYGPLFVVGYRIRRKQYLLIAVGFLAVIAFEAAYYELVAGDAFHRWKLLLSGTTVNDRVDVGFLQIAAGGTLHVWAPLDPLLMFFTKHDFGMLGYFAVPALWWGYVHARRDRAAPARLVRLLGLLAVVWIVFAAVALKNLILLPRYYMVAAYALYVCAAVWLAVVLWPRRPVLTIVLMVTGAVVHALAIAVDNKDPRFGERALVEYLKQHPGPLVTDPATANNIPWFCEWEKADCSGVVGRSPLEGDLYFYNPRNADHSSRFIPSSRIVLYRPQPGWSVVWSKTASLATPAAVLEHSGLRAIVPAALAAKLFRPGEAVKVLRVTPDGASR